MHFERLLIVCLDNLGDLVFVSTLLPRLRKHFPSASFDIWCKAYTGDVAALLPWIRRVIASDTPWARTEGQRRGRILPFLRAAREVRAGDYDVAVLANAPWRTAAAVAATGIPVRIGLRRHRNASFLTHVLAPADPQKSALRELHRLLEPLGVSMPEVAHYVLDPTHVAQRAQRIEERLSSKAVALHPFAGGRDRCVALPEWLQVARELSARGYVTLWIGTRSELNELRAIAPKGPSHFIDEIGDGSLADTVAALSRMTLFVGHDSGPLHIAGAFGVPTLGVFAPGEPLRTFPQGVGPSRLIAREMPSLIAAADILSEIDQLDLGPTNSASSRDKIFSARE